MINYSMDSKFGKTEHARRLIAGYVRLLQRRVKNDGWNPYFLTFMFSHLPGKKNTQLVAMEQALVRFYSTLLTRVVRNPAFGISAESAANPSCCPGLPSIQT
jgi:hypothetical protein